VEGSFYGSVILSSVFMKMGGFVFFRVVSLFDFFFIDLLFFYVGLFGSLVVGFNIFLSVDFKVFVSYRSIFHMNFVLFSLFMKSGLGVFGSLVVLLSHSFVSGVLFMFFGVFYLVTKSRRVYVNGGFFFSFLFLGFFFVLFLLLNFSLPISLGFWGEVFIYWGLFNFLGGGYFFIFFFLFLGCLFNFFFLSVLFYGKGRVFFCGYFKFGFVYFLLLSFFFYFFFVFLLGVFFE
jgi:NADH:ubiquinone oxidoreductase subunit 4 (subunit M)